MLVNNFDPDWAARDGANEQSFIELQGPQLSTGFLPAHDAQELRNKTLPELTQLVQSAWRDGELALGLKAAEAAVKAAEREQRGSRAQACAHVNYGRFLQVADETVQAGKQLLAGIKLLESGAEPATLLDRAFAYASYGDFLLSSNLSAAQALEFQMKTIECLQAALKRPEVASEQAFELYLQTVQNLANFENLPCGREVVIHAAEGLMRDIEALHASRVAPPQKKHLITEARLAVADTLMERGSYAKACSLMYPLQAQVLDGALGASLQSLTALRRIAECEYRLGQYGRACKTMQQALDVADQLGDALAPDVRVGLRRTYLLMRAA